MTIVFHPLTQEELQQIADDIITALDGPDKHGRSCCISGLNEQLVQDGVVMTGGEEKHVFMPSFASAIYREELALIALAEAEDVMERVEAYFNQ